MADLAETDTLEGAGSADRMAAEDGAGRRARRRSERYSRWGWRLAVVGEVALFILVWHIFTAVIPVLPPSILPSPGKVWSAFIELTSTGTLSRHLGFTARNFGVGFLAACAVAIPGGALIGSARVLHFAFAPLIWAMYAVPRSALAPLFILALGLGATSKVAVVFAVAVFPIMINVMEGARTLPGPLLAAGRVYGGGRWQLFRKIVLPSLLPHILVGLRLGLASGIAGAIIGEFMGSFEGLGLLLSRAAYTFDIPRALAIVIIVIVVAQVAMSIVRRLKVRLAPWDDSEWS